MDKGEYERAKRLVDEYEAEEYRKRIETERESVKPFIGKWFEHRYPNNKANDGYIDYTKLTNPDFERRQFKAVHLSMTDSKVDIYNYHMVGFYALTELLPEKRWESKYTSEVSEQYVLSRVLGHIRKLAG